MKLNFQFSLYFSINCHHVRVMVFRVNSRAQSVQNYIKYVFECSALKTRAQSYLGAFMEYPDCHCTCTKHSSKEAIPRQYFVVRTIKRHYKTPCLVTVVRHTACKQHRIESYKQTLVVGRAGFKMRPRKSCIGFSHENDSFDSTLTMSRGMLRSANGTHFRLMNLSTGSRQEYHYLRRRVLLGRKDAVRSLILMDRSAIMRCSGVLLVDAA